MTPRKILLTSAIALVALALASPALAQSNKRISVVATFSILGDMVQRIGGDHITLTTLVGADGDAHVYQPTPADARTLGGADVLFVNGLAFEGWIDRLVEASDFRGAQIVATAGITSISLTEDGGYHDQGIVDPHAWQSLPNAIVYVDNITTALAQADPANATAFYLNRATFVAEIEMLDAAIHAAIRTLPAERRTIVTSHDAFGYFTVEYGLTFLAPQGLSTEAEPSARDVAELITQIREQSISAVFVESISDSRLLEQIVLETGAAIGGTLYSDALSGPDGPAGTYLDMMRHNLTMLTGALNS
ncbi:MAG: metal ABC transporter substrate-binding protein [Pseudomonadota bacterium]